MKKEGWRLGHVVRGRGTETRVTNVTRNFGAEELTGSHSGSVKHGVADHLWRKTTWTAAGNMRGREAMVQVGGNAKEGRGKIEMVDEELCSAGSSGPKPGSRGSTPRGAKTGVWDGKIAEGAWRRRPGDRAAGRCLQRLEHCGAGGWVEFWGRGYGRCWRRHCWRRLS